MADNQYSQEHLDLAARYRVEPDDPIVDITLDNQKLGKMVNNLDKKLDIWTTAIQTTTELAANQNKLVVQQTTRLQETAKNFSELSGIISQFSKETKAYAGGLSQLKNTTESLETTSEALSKQMCEVEAGSLILDKRTQKVLENSKGLFGKIDSLIQTWTVSLTWIVFFAALAVGGFGVGYFVGYLNS